MYRLIAADMDGTLLNDKNEISPAVREAIQKARERGVVFTLATGRAIQGIEKYADILAGDMPVISCNGAVILTSETRRIIRTEDMTYEDTMTLMAEGISLGAVVAVWAGGRLFSTQTGGPYARFYKSLSNMEVYEIRELPKAPVTKVVWIFHGVTGRVLELQAKYTPPAGLQSKVSGEYFLEFYSASAGKGAGLRALARSLGIDMSETMAIGDNFNDIDMLEAAGLGIAMENAHTAVKAAADAVTASSSSHFDRPTD